MAEEMQFIDAEEITQKERFDYEDIIVKQIQRCVDLLSKERIYRDWRGIMMDNRSETINAVKTLHDLMFPFIKEKWNKNIKEILKQIGEAHKVLMEQEVRWQGKMVKIKVLGSNERDLPDDLPEISSYKSFLDNQYKKIFRELMIVYTERKKHIAKLSEIY